MPSPRRGLNTSASFLRLCFRVEEAHRFSQTYEEQVIGLSTLMLSPPSWQMRGFIVCHDTALQPEMKARVPQHELISHDNLVTTDQPGNARRKRRMTLGSANIAAVIVPYSWEPATLHWAVPSWTASETVGTSIVILSGRPQSGSREP